MKQLLRTTAIIVLLGDALLLVLLGRRWTRFTHVGEPGDVAHQITGWFLTWPDWLLRVSGALEFATAALLFQRWESQE